MAEREVIPIKNDEDRRALEEKLRAEGYFPRDEFDDITCEFENLDEEARANAEKIPGYADLPWHRRAALNLSEKEKLIEKYYPGSLIDPNTK